MPLGSFSGGFSSTAGYASGNEAQHVPRREPERRSTCQADHFLEALSVFIPITRVTLRRADPGKPFGFGSGRPLQRLSAPTALELCVTASVPLPGTGQEPVSDLDCVAILHQ